MTEPADTLTRTEMDAAIKAIFKRCQTDLEFRALCLADAAAAVREVTGKSLPDGVRLEFREPGVSSTEGIV